MSAAWEMGSEICTYTLNYIDKASRIAQPDFCALVAACRNYGAFPNTAPNVKNIRLQVLSSVNFAERIEFLQLCCQRRCWCRSENCGLLPKLDTCAGTDLGPMSDMLASAQKCSYWCHQLRCGSRQKYRASHRKPEVNRVRIK